MEIQDTCPCGATFRVFSENAYSANNSHQIWLNYHRLCIENNIQQANDRQINQKFHDNEMGVLFSPITMHFLFNQNVTIEGFDLSINDYKYISISSGIVYDQIKTLVDTETSRKVNFIHYAGQVDLFIDLDYSVNNQSIFLIQCPDGHFEQQLQSNRCIWLGRIRVLAQPNEGRGIEIVETHQSVIDIINKINSTELCVGEKT